MLISFLVPVYNVKNYIRKCLDSILCQTGADFEVILLDDGSTDGSEMICDEYALRYPEKVRVIHKENEGLLLTRRRGFFEAKGDLFVCVDSDDYIKENYLQTVVRALNKYDCDMLMFDYESVYPDGRTERSGVDIAEVCIFEGDTKKEILKKRLLQNKYNNMCFKVIKRSVLDFETDYGIFGIKNMCEDALQSYELYTRARKIAFIPESLYVYRRDINSISANVDESYWRALRTTFELGWKYAELWDMDEQTVGAYAARCVSHYCDFICWLITKADADEAQKRMIFSELTADEYFKKAVSLYDKKYFATKYLKLRNPAVIGAAKSYLAVKLIFKAENIMRRA